jgi:hypothetical protein
MKRKNIGSTFDSRLREEGLYEKVSEKRPAHAQDEDLERINSAADELNSEVMEVLEYQSGSLFGGVPKKVRQAPVKSTLVDIRRPRK